MRLAVPPAFAREFLTPVLKKFVELYPEIRLQIILHGGKFSTSLEDNLDFHFQIGKPKDSSLKVKTFLPILRGVYASHYYIAANGNRKTGRFAPTFMYRLLVERNSRLAFAVRFGKTIGQIGSAGIGCRSGDSYEIDTGRFRHRGVAGVDGKTGGRGRKIS